MKSGFEKKIDALNSTLQKNTDDYRRKIKERENEIETLKQNVEILHKRIKDLTSNS